jgi:predicted GNAT family N-acyltransferase
MEVIDVTTFEQLEVAYHIRYLVFVVEQGCPIQDEYDEYESVASHILIYENEQPIGTARWRVVEGVAKLERICVLVTHRQRGVGKFIVDALEERAKRRGIQQSKLHGQVQAEAFYHRLGYVTVSEPFVEDGIPHVLMVKEMH